MRHIPVSNPATYAGIFTPVRDLFAGTQEARSRGYKLVRFSFNVKGGRCEACQGDGVIKVEMHFLPDVYVPCDICKGKRYNRETVETQYKGLNIHQVLDMTVEETHSFFDVIPSIAGKLQTLMDVGWSYVRLGQAATTLSGGEAQRVKLASELSKRDTGQILYILDEPTTGLHFHDIKQLLQLLHRLRDHGNTVVVIEHNLDVSKTADWVLDFGPEGGYPYWHSEVYPQAGHNDVLHRILLFMFYLNDVDEGGETEFHYQDIKIKPKAGRTVIAPAYFTHTHRGNVPVSNNKYILTSWVLFNQAEQIYTLE
jgi:excinuclease ABC A subunit